MTSLTQVPLVHARAAIARSVLGNRRVDPRLGQIVLRPHQTLAAERLLDILAMHRGALLCDAVGLGKTFTALAVARASGSFAIVAPAIVGRLWHDATMRAGMRPAFVRSHEMLGRGKASLPAVDLLVVDEAHGFRNPAARRYASLAAACARSPVLLVSATPIHNSRDDLCALVALFLGSSAYDLDDAALAQLLVRRTSVETNVVPKVIAMPAQVIESDREVTAAIRALPPPVPARDGAVAAALVAGSLLRAWASSGAALQQAIRRRLARGNALLESMRRARYPSRGELRAWTVGDDSVQLAFAELVVSSCEAPSDLAKSVERHLRALEPLPPLIAASDDVSRRVEFVRRCRSRHCTEKIIAFTAYEATARAIYTALKRDGRIALMSARRGEVAGGTVTRADVIQAFAPRASHTRDPPGAFVIDLLVTTDLLGEGVNLQNASVLIHLDLPWTSARIEQRTGRLARLGSIHSHVASYELRPDVELESALRTVEKIDRKRRLAIDLFGDDRTSTAVTERERLSALMTKWLASHPERDSDGMPTGGCTIAAGETHANAGNAADAHDAHDCARSRGQMVFAVALARVDEPCALVACVSGGDRYLLSVDVSARRVDTSARCALRLAGIVSAADDGSGREEIALQVVEVVHEWSAQLHARSLAGVETLQTTRSDGRRRRVRGAERATARASLVERRGSALIEAQIRTALVERHPIATESALLSGAMSRSNSTAPPVLPAISIDVIILVLPADRDESEIDCGPPNDELDCR